MVLHDSHHMSVSGDCGESEPSSAASEDVLDLQEAFVNTERLRDSVSLLLNGLGEDVSREGLRDTPKVSHIASLHLCMPGPIPMCAPISDTLSGFIPVHL